MGEAIVDQLRPRNNMSDLERYTLHAIRQTLQGMNIYHSVWEIVIEQRKPNELTITAWIPERVTMPGGLQKPIIPIHFNHTGDVMRDFTEVSYLPIVMVLAREMTTAFKLGQYYGKQ